MFLENEELYSINIISDYYIIENFLSNLRYYDNYGYTAFIFNDIIINRGFTGKEYTYRLHNGVIWWEIKTIHNFKEIIKRHNFNVFKS